MNKGDLVRVSFGAFVEGANNGQVGIVVEYFPQDESLQLQYEIGVPLYEALCVVLINNSYAFFYESELTLINQEE